MFCDHILSRLSIQEEQEIREWTSSVGGFFLLAKFLWWDSARIGRLPFVRYTLENLKELLPVSIRTSISLRRSLKQLDFF